MTSRYAHDETYALRAEGMRGARVAPGASDFKWKKLAAVAGAALSAGAVGTAYLKLETGSAYNAETAVILEAQHAQLRGSSVAAADDSPTFSYEFIRPANELITTFSDADVSQALYAYVTKQEALLAADSSLTADELHAKQQTLRGISFMLSSCVRNVFNEWVEGKEYRAIPGDEFPVFKEHVLSTCPNAVAAFEASGSIASPTNVQLPAPFVVGGLGPVILNEPPAENPSPTIVEPPRAGEVLSDPQPGPPAGEEDAFVPNGKEELKSMLMKQFGLSEPEGGEPGEATEAGEAPAPEVTDAEKANDEAEAKAELRQALLNILASRQPEATTQSPIIITMADHAQGWNWLHPAVQSYSLLKDSDRDTVSVPTVYQYLQTEGSTRAQKLISELLRTQSEYQRTLNCFMQGANNRGELSHDEYEKVIQWMNDACASEGQVEQQEVREAEETHPGHSFMTKEEFKGLIGKHFESVLAAFNSGQQTVQHYKLKAQHVIDKVQSCIDLATENAVDTATGEVSSNKLAQSLDWILQSCVDQ